MSSSDRLPDYPLGFDLVRSLKSALDAGDETTVAALICTRVRPVDAVIELANDDWMKDPSAQLPPGALLGSPRAPRGVGCPLNGSRTPGRRRTRATGTSAARGTRLRPRAPHGTARALLNHGSPGVGPDALPKVLKACAPAPAVIEVLLNACPQLHVPASWRALIPEEVHQEHRPFYRSLFARAGRPRRLGHLCPCAIRRRLGKRCSLRAPRLPLPAALQSHLLLEPEGVLH